ncbi:MAG: hypothetical protein KC910_27590 [Candidatus Eremiobacteraeota bacterium]|nr:hypothetical protein [Candidatus Eremiobacteraeota bacterium]
MIVRLCLLLLLALPVLAQEPVATEAVGVSVVPSEGWVVDNPPADEGPAVWVFPKDRSDKGFFSIENLGDSRTLKGAWHSLRFDVIVRLGCEILSDAALTIDGARGRRIIFQDDTNGYFRALVPRGKDLYLIRAFSPRSDFGRDLEAFKAMTLSVKWLNGAVDPAPVEDEESDEAPEE